MKHMLIPVGGDLLFLCMTYNNDLVRKFPNTSKISR